MKTINETFQDKEFSELLKIKSELKMSWHDFIITLAALSKGEIRKQNG
jgi:hypothetical protein